MLKNAILSLSTAVLFSLSASALTHANDTQDAALQQAMDALDATLPGKLLNNPYDIKWRTDGNDRKDSVVKSEGAPGGMAYQVKVKKTKPDPWDIATRIPMKEDIAKGDVILLSYWARAAKVQKGKEYGDVTITLQRNVEPYDSIIEERVELGSEWKLRSLSGKASRDYSADKTDLNFNLARAKQTIEFGQFYIMNLGPNGDASKYMGK